MFKNNKTSCVIEEWLHVTQVTIKIDPWMS